MSHPSSKNWARDLSRGLLSLKQLSDASILPSMDNHEFEQIKAEFDIRVPQSFLAEIQRENQALAKQFIPTKNELIFLPEELSDPIGDEVWTPVEGLTHRYPDRVLLKPTYLCAGYCRFCFRRYKVSQSEFNLNEIDYQKCIDYIRCHKEIEEVILTGGDPLTLTNKGLEKILQDLSLISSVKIIRFHSRIPSLLPSRVDLHLIDILKRAQKTIWIVAHMNHADEFHSETIKALSALIDHGFPVVLQSVLLKGINDTPEQLVRLLKTAVENRVKPYYLHYPDLAKGTNHFRIPLKDAVALVKSLRGRISGLCIPHFIVDIPGGKGKIEVNAHRAVELSEGTWEFESPLDGSLVRVKYP
jgi:lysine 2,3-aminomutase